MFHANVSSVFCFSLYIETFSMYLDNMHARTSFLSFQISGRMLPVCFPINQNDVPFGYHSFPFIMTSSDDISA